ncbi:MAG: PASTA domain-containing protein, partial [Thermoleophilaceae bacterium]|nr:PASTA domain-containing protein [Thermoleophilaceae bacterium]
PSPQPSRRRRWPWLLLAVLVAAAAAAGAIALVLGSDRVTVPRVTGETIEQASADLARAGFELRTRRTTSEQSAGIVIAQDPEAGAKVDKGSTVTLVVSSGPGKRTVPDVRFLTEAQATRRLSRLGFLVEAHERHSSTVEKGIVIATDPLNGTRQPVGTRVQLFVSSGPRQVKVPDVTGLDVDSAKTALSDKRFTYTTNEVTSDEPKGRVVSQLPAAGTKVDEGSRVTLDVSKGPAKAEVPDVLGLPPADARRELAAAGLGVQVREKAVATEDQDGVVVLQRPAPQTRIQKGRTVVIYVGRFQPPDGGGDMTTPPGGTG